MRDFTKLDFAKKPTNFAKEYERQREILLLELQNTVEARGFISKLIYILTKKPVWN